MDWHVWHSLIMALMALVDTDGLVSHMKKHVLHTPGCSLRWCIFIIPSGSSMEVAYTGSEGSSPFFMESNSLRGNWVKPLARLQFDITRNTSMDSSYLSASFLMVLSLLLLSISLATLVRILALPVKVSNTQWYTHNKSIRICNLKKKPTGAPGGCLSVQCPALPDWYVRHVSSMCPQLRLHSFPIKSRSPRSWHQLRRSSLFPASTNLL